MPSHLNSSSILTDDDIRQSRPVDDDLHQSRPALTLRGHFLALVEEVQLDPNQLYLNNQGDMILTQKVPICYVEGTVPVFVDIVFFLEEQKLEPTLHCKKCTCKLPVKPLRVCQLTLIPHPRGLALPPLITPLLLSTPMNARLFCAVDKTAV